MAVIPRILDKVASVLECYVSFRRRASVCFIIELDLLKRRVGVATAASQTVRSAMFPGIDIAGLAVGILSKMGRQGGKHGTVDVAKGLVGTCLLSILYVLLLDALGVHGKEQFETLQSIKCRYLFPVGHRLNQHHCSRTARWSGPHGPSSDRTAT